MKRPQVTKTETHFINGMRDKGFAIVVFTPEEMETVNDVKLFEDLVAEYGQNLITDEVV